MISKYKSLNKNTKTALLCSIPCFLLMSCFGVITTQGWHVPNLDEVHYDEGIVKVVEIPKSKKGTVAHIEIKTNDGRRLHLGCSYTAYYYINYSNCAKGKRKEFLNKVHGKNAKVGWYIQKPFLGFHNPYPQMISLQIDGNYVNDFEYDKKAIYLSDAWKRFLIGIMANFIIFSIMYILIYSLPNPNKS